MTSRSLSFFGLIILLAALVDQGIKLLVEVELPLHARIEILPFLSILHSRNTGIAFSLFSGVGGPWLSLLMVAVIIFMAVLAIRTEANQFFARFGFAFIIGGAFGNLIDRALRGYVVDYVYFHTPVWSFAVFNLADALITVGAGLVILDEFLAWRRAKRRDSAR